MKNIAALRAAARNCGRTTTKLAPRLLDRDPNGLCQQASIVLGAAAPLSKNAYKLPIFETLVRRAILAAAQA